MICIYIYPCEWIDGNSPIYNMRSTVKDSATHTNRTHTHIFNYMYNNIYIIIYIVTELFFITIRLHISSQPPPAGLRKLPSPH